MHAMRGRGVLTQCKVRVVAKDLRDGYLGADVTYSLRSDVVCSSTCTLFAILRMCSTLKMKGLASIIVILCQILNCSGFSASVGYVGKYVPDTSEISEVALKEGVFLFFNFTAIMESVGVNTFYILLILLFN